MKKFLSAVLSIFLCVSLASAQSVIVYRKTDPTASINWDSIDEEVLTAINWTDYQTANINWADIQESDLSGINWTAYENETINWAAINELNLTGINWDYYAIAGGINWTTFTEEKLDGINWESYELGDGINWTAINETKLSGINWDYYAVESINWASILETDLSGINWSYYANAGGINWSTFTESEFDGINWDYYAASGSSRSGNFVLYLRPQQAKLPASGSAAINPAGNALWTILFDDDDTECVYWAGTFLRPFSGTLKSKLAYKAYSATSGTMELELSMSCVSDGDSDDDSPTFGTADSLSATVPGTAGILDILADPSLEGDSCATDDLVYIKLCRDADDGTNDTATGDMEFTGGVVYAE